MRHVEISTGWSEMQKKCPNCSKEFHSRRETVCCSKQCAAEYKREPAKIKVGDIFGKNKVTEVVHKNNRWTAVGMCDCGNPTEFPQIELLRGRGRSCGCATLEKITKSKTTHGMSNSKAWNAWAAMRDRCSSKNNASYMNYGGRGISVCARWEKFENFLADMGEPKNHESLDRIDVNGNYEPENCRWADFETQSNNKRASHYITAGGETLTIAQWSRKTGVNRTTIHYRVKAGWPTEKLFEQKDRRYGR